jgi:hypothetical protein
MKNINTNFSTRVVKKQYMCTHMGMVSTDGLTWLKCNSYQQLYKCSSGCNNILIYVVFGILSTRLDKIGKATSLL